MNYNIALFCMEIFSYIDGIAEQREIVAFLDQLYENYSIDFIKNWYNTVYLKLTVINL